MPDLSADDRRRLAGVLARLASDHAGERDAAANLATRIVRDRNVNWLDVLQPDPPAQERSTWPPGGGDLVVCLRWLGELSPWETGFVLDLRQKHRCPLSPAQAAKLHQIADALRARGLA